MLKKILRILWRTILGLFALGLAFVLVVVFINCFDEDPKPVPATLRVPPNQLTSGQNLFMGIVGLDAPEGTSPVDFAEKKMAQYKKLVDALDRGESIPAPTTFGMPMDGQVDFHGDVYFKSPLGLSIWRTVPSHEAEIRKLLEGNQLLYRNYLALHGYQAYYDTSPPTPSPPYFFIIRTELRNLFLADIALRMHSTSVEERKKALMLLEADMRTWHAMLTGEGHLLSQMFAASYLNADCILLADMIADEKVDVESLSPMFERMVAPYAYADWKTNKSIVREFQLQEPRWRLLEKNGPPHGPDDDTWWDRKERDFGGHFLKMNATSNLDMQHYLQALAVANADPANLTRARDAYKEWANEQASYRLDYLYNPYGKILISIDAFSMMDQYQFRSYDVAALQHMVKLGFEIRRRRIGAAGVPAFMAAHPEYAVHPVTRQAFFWNAENNEMSLSPQASTGKGRRFTIPVWHLANDAGGDRKVSR